jgi:hypothetical protein
MGGSLVQLEFTASEHPPVKSGMGKVVGSNLSGEGKGLLAPLGDFLALYPELVSEDPSIKDKLT